MAKIINQRAFVKQTKTKKSSKEIWDSFAVRTGLVTGLPLCLQRTLTPGHGESIYKKRRNLAVSSCGAYGTRNRLAALLAKNPDPGSRGEYIQKKKKPCGFFLRCVRDSNP